MSLFAEEQGPLRVLDDATCPVVLWRAWLPAGEARAALRDVQDQVQPEAATIQMFGKPVTIPRLQAWHGDADAAYRYSGLWMQPAPWTPVLQDLRERLQSLPRAPRFNSVLVNLYRDGQDCVGWHADDEHELGREPVIASLSLGATRRFLLKPRGGAASGRRQSVSLDLEQGDLLVMGGRTQRDYVHTAPRTARQVGARWNLTFRYVRPRSA